ncbi:MAG: hypothetical protein R3F62_10195 [Planctomycetota bacterium]
MTPIPTQRVVDRLGLEPRSCVVCGAGTAEDKPYCSRHVDRSPYVRQLLARLEASRAVEHAA